jgi:hypothetical protein
LYGVPSQYPPENLRHPLLGAKVKEIFEVKGQIFISTFGTGRQVDRTKFLVYRSYYRRHGGTLYTVKDMYYLKYVLELKGTVSRDGFGF